MWNHKENYKKILIIWRSIWCYYFYDFVAFLFHFIYLIAIVMGYIGSLIPINF